MSAPMEALQEVLAKGAELRHQRDLAAYRVLGCARVLFRLLDPETAKLGLWLIEEYDRRNQAVEDFYKAQEAA